VKFATFDAKDTIDAFIRRTYPRASDEERHRIEAAMLRANPQLRQPEAGRASTIVVVPDVAGVEADAPGAAAVARGLVQAIRGATPELRKALQDRLEQQHNRLSERLDELTGRDVGRAKNPEVRKQLSAIREAIRGQQKELSARRKTSDEALSALESDIDAFLSGNSWAGTDVRPAETPQRRASRARKREG
jgi:hypothetical protein